MLADDEQTEESFWIGKADEIVDDLHFKIQFYKQSPRTKVWSVDHGVRDDDCHVNSAILHGDLLTKTRSLKSRIESKIGEIIDENGGWEA